jgi:hypothetical protein
MYKDKLQNVFLTNLNKYLHYDTNEKKVSKGRSENNGSKKLQKINVVSGKLIIAVCA